MLNPITEVRDFVRAALIEPLPRDHWEPDAAFRRRRVVSFSALVVGTIALAMTIRIEPGDPLFTWAALGVAVIWLIGGLGSGQLHLGHARTREDGVTRPVVQPLAIGLILLAVFLAGALVVSRIPVLRGPVDELLDHARLGNLAVVALVTAVSGVTEELFFRGGLYAGVGRRHAVAWTAGLYTITTIGTGVVLLAFAALALGVVVGLQRRVTGGILGPIITHLTWSLGMLFLLPPTLELGDRLLG